MSENDKTNDNYIKTFLRINPINNMNHYINNSDYLHISNDNRNITLSLSQENKTEYHFDKIFYEEDNQKHLFEVIGKPLCCSVLEGYNSTIISYGKKNTGKTYTLLGKSIQDIQKEFQADNNDMNTVYFKYLNNKGILTFCIEYIFNFLYLNPHNNNFIFNISLSCIEIFDDNILDYFNIDNFEDNNNFNLNNFLKKKYSSDFNFTKLNVSSTDEALFLLNQGLELRNLIFNEINLKGINGHKIITLYIEKINKETNQIFKSSFNFVELSSCSNILNNNYYLSLNKSLEIFSYIINQLSDNVKRENIKYNNSILTNILKESLGGNSKTSVIVNISPCNENYLDSFQSLNFSTKFKNIINYPTINEIISYNVDNSYYNELLKKIERLKNEKNYLLNYLGNLNNNKIDKDRDYGPKKMINQSQNQNQNINQKKKEKEEDLKILSNNINILNSNIDNINKDIINKKKEKKIFFDKYNKIKISLFKKNKEFKEKEKQINDIDSNKIETQKKIMNYEKENINIDSLILQKNLLLKENKLKNDEEINELDKEISLIHLKIKEKENILNNLKEKYNNILEENKSKNNIIKELEIIKENLLEEKREKEQKIDENKNEYDKMINKSEEIKNEIINKNSQFNNFQKNLNQYDEYENKTINDFKKFYDDNNKKEVENNNKFYDIQKYIPQKEKELKQINNDIDHIYQNKFKIFNEQEKIKKQINDYEKKYKSIEYENQIYNEQINSLQEKLTILTLNLNYENNNQEDNDAVLEEKNNDLHSSIISFDIISSNKSIENDIFLFKNNFNVELDENKKRQLLENKKKLLELEQKKNISLKEKKNVINNEIFKFKINQLKNTTYNNKDKLHNQYNLVKIEENMDKVNEKEKIIKNYQESLISNYNLINNYLNENKNTIQEDNNNAKDSEISINDFKNLFNKFIEKYKEIDEEFELVKREFKENGAEYRWTSKEVVNTSLKNNPLLKNYEEIYKNNENNNNNSFVQNKIDDNYKRITMNNNKILNDVKNLWIYNKIYPNKRKANDVIKIIPKRKEKKIDPFSYNLEDGEMFNNKNSKQLDIINSCNEKENKNNNIFSNTTNSKGFFFKNDKKIKKSPFKSPDKTFIRNNWKNKYKTNTSNYKVNYTNNLKRDRNKNSKNNLFSLLKESSNNKK